MTRLASGTIYRRLKRAAAKAGLTLADDPPGFEMLLPLLDGLGGEAISEFYYRRGAPALASRKVI
jgi:hypothetical protein